MNKFDKRLSRQLWAQYILALLAWAFAVLVLAVLAWGFFGAMRWDGTELLYPLIHLLHRYVVFVYILVEIFPRNPGRF